MSLTALSAYSQDQDDFRCIPIVEGRVYAVKDNGKCGLVKSPLSGWDSEEERRAKVIAPIKYDDITYVSVLETNGVNSPDKAYCAIAAGKNTLYLDEGYGLSLTEPMSTKFGWLSRATGTRLKFAGVFRPDGNGFDLQIIYDWPRMATTITGPFDISYYQNTTIAGKDYYFINARKFGNTNQTVKYDVFGHQLSDNELSHLDSYYKNLLQGLKNDYKTASATQRQTTEYERKLYQLAMLGDAEAINIITEAYYKPKIYDRVLAWGWGPAVEAKAGDAMFYAAQCYRLGQGTPVIINHAQHLYQKAQEAGCASAAAGLLAIKKIETPITLKAGKEPVIDDLDFEGLEKAAKEGYIGAIETYCHRMTFHTFGTAWFDDQTSDMYDDKQAAEVLPLLLAAAPKNANCQLMLACIYAGAEAVGLERNYAYSFRNVEKAKYWIEKFCNNPARDKAIGWGYEKDNINSFITNIRNMR